MVAKCWCTCSRRTCMRVVVCMCILQGVPPAALQKVTNPELREFIETCIKQSPEERPEARQLLKSHFFDSIRPRSMNCSGVIDKAVLLQHRPTSEDNSSPLTASASEGSAASEDEEQHQPPTSRAISQPGINGVPAPPSVVASLGGVNASGFERATTPPPTPSVLLVNGAPTATSSYQQSPTSLASGQHAWAAQQSMNGAATNGTYSSARSLAQSSSSSSIPCNESLMNSLQQPMDRAASSVRQSSVADTDELPTTISEHGDYAHDGYAANGVAEGQHMANGHHHHHQHHHHDADQDPNRDFMVSCRGQGDSKFMFQLKFMEPEGTASPVSR